jgi:hypothetical protein
MREATLERVDENGGAAVDDRNVVPGIPRQSASSGSPSDRARSSVPRNSASACATDGGPENAAEIPRDAGMVRNIRRRTDPGIAPKTCRTGEPTSRSTDSSSYG